MWFRSYLSGRTYRVVYAGGTSSVVYIVCSVPQGSVLGPVLYVLYVADLADIVNRHSVTRTSNAGTSEDSYLHCCREDITTPATRLKECIVDVGRWISANRLKLNTDKTELLWTGSRHTISQLHGHGPSIQLGAVTVPACNHVRLLGVIISADLRLDHHVSVHCRLLQSAVGRSTKVCYRQVAAGHERCSASCERREKVRPRLDTPASL